jgi:hypothetical protein
MIIKRMRITHVVDKSAGGTARLTGEWVGAFFKLLTTSIHNNNHYSITAADRSRVPSIHLILRLKPFPSTFLLY